MGIVLSSCFARHEFAAFVALVINFNTSRLTVRCVDSLLATGIQNILVLDNASCSGDVVHLRAALGNYGAYVRIIESHRNLGFAAGSNLLIDLAIRNPVMRFVLLLNNDAVALPPGMATMLRTALEESVDLAGGRMLAYPTLGGSLPLIDSLGISMYRALLASNRKSVDEKFLGPTGGCAIYSRRLVEDLNTTHGHVFDPDFFCYAEDTDMCVRSRLLGYETNYVDTPVAMHDGQASSDGSGDFVLYHGIRNSIWTVFKSIPMNTIIRNLPWFFAAHLGIVVRHSLRGKGGVIWRLYRDAFLGLPKMWKKRGIIRMTRRTPARRFNDFVTPRFYEDSYLKTALRELLVWRR